MFLVDTSAWIEFGSRQPRAVGKRLRALIDSDIAIFVTGTIVQEVLQGARDESHFQRMRTWFAPHRIATPEHAFNTHAAAASLYARCRWKGFTPRSSNDCLIAQIALDFDLTLLHDDSDFEKMAKVEPRLRLA
ncbi:type II toxin-antitoxin system VapC family toxin [Nevskia ramosa]|uniref:type II toxin-antitoxin system VapC family toxin n=1 Tax=Nevskia ramosa TaxID=64002 RepID=UPI0023533168|nr:PIN domain-containing protein [Nevskia ramosa]